MISKWNTNRAAAIIVLSCCLFAPVFVPGQAEKKEAQSGPSAADTKRSVACGERYCAESSRKLLPESPIAPPKVNQVFRDPDFGSRMVRVSDESGIGGALAGFSFSSNSSAEINEWGKFDPSLGPNGGYYFYVMTSGGGAVVFSMDAATMQVTPHCNGLPQCRLPSGGSFSYVDPHTLYGHFGGGNYISSYDVSTGRESTIYDLTKCPNIPNELEGYPGSVSNSGDDTKFSGYPGGRGQGNGSLVTYYDRTTGRCYWYETATGRLGGAGIPTTQVRVGVLSPPAAPKLKRAPGNIPSGDYYVQLTAKIRRPSGPGETLPSPEAHIHLDSTGGIAISPPEIDNVYGMRVTGYTVYIGRAPGEEMRQASFDQIQDGYTQSVPLAKGGAPPTIPTAGYNVHNARLSRDGNAVKIAPQGSRVLIIWVPATATLSACSIAGEGQGSGVANYCGGHTVLGYSHMINHGGPGSTFSLLYRPLSDLNHFERLVPAEESVSASMDTHWSWNNDDPSDTAPVCGAFSGSNGKQGDGTRNSATNPLLAVRQAWDREVVCVATSGAHKVWRFAHHHATGACNANAREGSCFGAIAIGNVSQDGKFFLFGTDWDWTLGSDPHKPGCPTSGRCRTDSFVVELK